jgi:hypothetical protein
MSALLATLRRSLTAGLHLRRTSRRCLRRSLLQSRSSPPSAVAVVAASTRTVTITGLTSPSCRVDLRRARALRQALCAVLLPLLPQQSIPHHPKLPRLQVRRAAAM